MKTHNRWPEKLQPTDCGVKTFRNRTPQESLLTIPEFLERDV